jgi:Ca2+-binding EF-hand superfamily protein
MKRADVMDPEDMMVNALAAWDMDNSGYISEER